MARSLVLIVVLMRPKISCIPWSIVALLFFTCLPRRGWGDAFERSAGSGAVLLRSIAAPPLPSPSPLRTSSCSSLANSCHSMMHASSCVHMFIAVNTKAMNRLRPHRTASSKFCCQFHPGGGEVHEAADADNADRQFAPALLLTRGPQRCPRQSPRSGRARCQAWRSQRPTSLPACPRSSVPGSIPCLTLSPAGRRPARLRGAAGRRASTCFNTA